MPRTWTLIFSSLVFVLCSQACGGPSGPNVTLMLKGASSGIGINSGRVIFVSTTGKTSSFESDPDGVLSVNLKAGKYSVHIQSNGVYSIPDDPFYVLEISAPSSGLTEYPLNLPTVGGSGSMGWLDVRVKSNGGGAVPGALVVAQGVGAQNTQAPVSHAFTDSKGFARIPNLPEGDYSIKAHGEDVHTTQVQSASVAAGQGSETEIKISDSGLGVVEISYGSVLPDGLSVSFVEPLSGQTVPGLTEVLEGGLFVLSGVAPGTYGLRMEDETWVLSPDDLARSGGVEVKVSGTGGKNEITLQGAESIALQSATSGLFTGKSPQFTWQAQPTVDFYVVEVRNQDREVVYGGFAGDGTPRFMIPPENNTLNYGSLTYLTPGVAAQYVPNEPLKSGNTYRWRVWACVEDGSAPKGYRALSASHFRAGIFHVE